MAKLETRNDSYRWVILLCMVPICAITQIFWLTFASISDYAAEYYHVSSFAIALLSMSYMITYIVLSIPVSIFVDKKGVRASLLVGALLTAVFGTMRALVSSNFYLVVIAQFGLAVAQPFIVNNTTKIAATWFPMNQRSTATGIISMAGYVGMIVTMVLMPVMVTKMGMTKSLLTLAGAGIVTALLVIIFLKEKTDNTYKESSRSDETFSFSKLEQIKENKPFVLMLMIMLIALGIFNALMTCIGDMFVSRRITAEQSGILGGVIIIAGLVGAVLIPMYADKYGKRQSVITFSLVVSVVGMCVLFYAKDYNVLRIASALTGFFMMGVAPVAFELGTELAYPVPEASSYGLLMQSGNLSSILFLVLLYGLQSESGSMAIPLTILIILMMVGTILSLRLREEKIQQLAR